jgi:plasmid maintenance system killer protein
MPPVDPKLIGPDGKPTPGNWMVGFQEYTDEQVAMLVARDRAETLRAKAAEDYRKSLTVIASSKHTEEMCQRDMADFFVEMQSRYQAWCKAQDAVDNDQKRVRDEILAAQAEEKAAEDAVANAELKAKEKEAGLLQGKDVAEALAAGVVVGGFGSAAPALAIVPEVPVAQPAGEPTPNPA